MANKAAEMNPNVIPDINKTNLENNCMTNPALCLSENTSWCKMILPPSTRRINWSMRFGSLATSGKISTNSSSMRSFVANGCLNGFFNTDVLYSFAKLFASVNISNLGSMVCKVLSRLINDLSAIPTDG